MNQTKGCLDSTLEDLHLKPGIYTIVLTAHENFAKGPTYGDGFTGKGKFTDVFGHDRTRNFVVDIVITPVTRTK